MIAVSVFEAVWRHPSGALLAVQLLGLLLYPLMEDTGAGRGLFNTFGVLVLALVLWVVVRSPTANWIAWLLACGGNCWRARSTSTRPPA